jgi:hypothetical protein
MTKTKDGRTVVLTPDVRQLLKNQLERLEAFQKKTGKPSPYFFIHMSGPNRGERIQDSRRTWVTACKALVSLEVFVCVRTDRVLPPRARAPVSRPRVALLGVAAAPGIAGRT